MTDLKTIILDKPLAIASGDDGSLCFVTRDEDVVSQAKAFFGREWQSDLLVKIYHRPIHGELENFYWGKYFDFVGLERTRSRLVDAIKVQNLFSFEGFAPRIYGIFIVENKKFGTSHYALLTDDIGLGSNFTGDVGRTENRRIYARIERHPLSKELTLPFFDEGSARNTLNRKLVDWQGAKINQNYLEGLKKRYLESTNFGDSKYQTVPELNIDEGIRKMEIRYKDLGLDKLDFKEKTVIDVGCSGGNFLNCVSSLGAKYAVGVDWERVIKGARELSNYLGYWNIDYFYSHLAVDLPPKALKNKPYDFIFFTSMITHVGVPEYLHDLGKFMILEINHKEQIGDTLGLLMPYWDLEYIGQSTDFGDRAIYHCRNKILN